MKTVAELERRIAALERRLGGLSAMAPPAFGGEHRPTQVGFPVQLTSAYSAQTGYSWQQLVLDPATASVGYASIPRTGDGAVTPDNNVDLASGTRGWLEVDPQAGGWLFTPAGASGPSLPVVTKVCVAKNGSGYVTGVTYEWRSVTLPAGAIVSDPVCVTDATDCCDGADSAGAATITFAASAQTPGTPASGTATITFAASATSAGGSGTSAGASTITFAAAATSVVAVASGSATITFAATGAGGTAYSPCDDYTVDGITMSTTGANAWGEPGPYSMTAASDGSSWALFYLGAPVATYGPWDGVGCRTFTPEPGWLNDTEVCCV